MVSLMFNGKRKKGMVISLEKHFFHFIHPFYFIQKTAGYILHYHLHYIQCIVKTWYCTAFRKVRFFHKSKRRHHIQYHATISFLEEVFCFVALHNETNITSTIVAKRLWYDTKCQWAAAAACRRSWALCVATASAPLSCGTWGQRGDGGWAPSPACSAGRRRRRKRRGGGGGGGVGGELVS